MSKGGCHRVTIKVDKGGTLPGETATSPEGPIVRFLVCAGGAASHCSVARKRCNTFCSVSCSAHRQSPPRLPDIHYLSIWFSIMLVLKSKVLVSLDLEALQQDPRWIEEPCATVLLNFCKPSHLYEGCGVVQGLLQQ